MAKAGQTKTVTTKDKDFSAPGAQGQKGQDAKQVTPPADGGTPPAEKAPEHTPEVITGEHVLQNMRDKGHQV